MVCFVRTVEEYSCSFTLKILICQLIPVYLFHPVLLAAQGAPRRESVHRNLLKAITGLSNDSNICFLQDLI